MSTLKKLNGQILPDNISYITGLFARRSADRLLAKKNPDRVVIYRHDKKNNIFAVKFVENNSQQIAYYKFDGKDNYSLCDKQGNTQQNKIETLSTVQLGIKYTKPLSPGTIYKDINGNHAIAILSQAQKNGIRAIIRPGTLPNRVKVSWIDPNTNEIRHKELEQNPKNTTFREVAEYNGKGFEALSTQSNTTLNIFLLKAMWPSNKLLNNPTTDQLISIRANAVYESNPKAVEDHFRRGLGPIVITRGSRNNQIIMHWLETNGNDIPRTATFYCLKDGSYLDSSSKMRFKKLDDLINYRDDIRNISPKLTNNIELPNEARYVHTYDQNHAARLLMANNKLNYVIYDERGKGGFDHYRINILYKNPQNNTPYRVQLVSPLRSGNLVYLKVSVAQTPNNPKGEMNIPMNMTVSELVTNPQKVVAAVKLSLESTPHKSPEISQSSIEQQGNLRRLHHKMVNNQPNQIASNDPLHLETRPPSKK